MGRASERVYKCLANVQYKVLVLIHHAGAGPIEFLRARYLLTYLVDQPVRQRVVRPFLFPFPYKVALQFLWDLDFHFLYECNLCCDFHYFSLVFWFLMGLISERLTFEPPFPGVSALCRDYRRELLAELLNPAVVFGVVARYPVAALGLFATTALAELGGTWSGQR
jgi:hypothetical protein